MKSVLMVVHSLAEDKFPGASRILDYIGRLKNYGWEPVVMVHGTGSGSLDKPSLQLPEGIDIIRTGSISTSGLPQAIKPLSSFLTSFLHGRQALWEFLTLRKAVRIIKNGGADLVYTVSPPYSPHLVGLRLKKKYPNLPWVADLSFANAPARSCEKSFTAGIEAKADIVLPRDSCVQAQELPELFERACRAVAAKKLENIAGGLS